MAGQNNLDNLRKNYDCRSKIQGVNFLVFEENCPDFISGQNFIQKEEI